MQCNRHSDSRLLCDITIFIMCWLPDWLALWFISNGMSIWTCVTPVTQRHNGKPANDVPYITTSAQPESRKLFAHLTYLLLLLMLIVAAVLSRLLGAYIARRQADFLVQQHRFPFFCDCTNTDRISLHAYTYVSVWNVHIENKGMDIYLNVIASSFFSFTFLKKKKKIKNKIKVFFLILSQSHLLYRLDGPFIVALLTGQVFLLFF
jgi:hypothetical protein